MAPVEFRRHVLTEPDEYAYLRRTIELILFGKDHRDQTNTLIERRFLTEAIEFFKQIVDAKMSSTLIDLDWYKDNFLNDQQDKDLLAACGGISLKSITNKRKTSRREVVLEESLKNYDSLLGTISELCDSNVDIDLAISFRGVTVHLNLNESLVVINALAMRRNQIRGGSWSSLGKNIEYPLLKTMCMLFEVPETNYSRGNRQGLREIDFCLLDENEQLQKCEVKLMGKGNPEGADALYARGANVFVASKLSDTNIRQLDNEGVKWVELNKPFGFKKFGEILVDFGIQHSELCLSEDELIDRIKEVTSQLSIEDFERS